MEAWWKDWPEVRALAEGKRILLYGRSEDWVHKTVRKLPHQPEYIIDRNEAYHGEPYMDLPVVLPSKLDGEPRDDIFIVITTGSYEGVVELLMEKGFEAGRHFCCSPEFKDYGKLQAMRSHKRKILVSSSDFLDKARARFSRAGGGLFVFTTSDNTLEQVAKGPFRQIVRVNGHIYAIDYVNNKVCVFDGDFTEVEAFPLDRPNYCGFAYSAERDVFFLTNSSFDTICVHERVSFRRVQEIYYSEKHKDGDHGVHHLNDVCIAGNHIYVSYFSHQGTFKRGVYDGGVAEIHMDRLDSERCPVYTGLWMPHSPQIIEGKLCVLDSMRGRLYADNQSTLGEFDGFARGLAHDGQYYYIGQSENMYMSRILGTRKNIMLNAGFYMFDPVTKASRFYAMLDSMNVHDLMVL